MKILVAFSLSIMVLAGCATQSAEQVREVTARELGIAYYYPEARLRIVQQSSDKFLLTLTPGPSAMPEVRHDGLLILGFYAVGFYCPAWRLARQAGAPAAILNFLDSSSKESESAEIALTQHPARLPEAKGKKRPEILNFSDETSRTVLPMWCKHPEKLNRSWHSR